MPKFYRMVWNYVRDYANLTEGEFHNGHVFNFNQTEEFWDGYAGQFFTSIDDIFQGKDPDTRSMTAQKLIHMVSPEPYSLRVATIEEKAHCFYRSRCIVATSNMEPEFSTANLGLQDNDALLTRITLAVEMLKDKTFAIRNQVCAVKGEDGQRKKNLTLEELAAVVAEAIIQRENEKCAPVLVNPIPRFRGVLESARLKFEAQGKDKEKEKVPEWQDSMIKAILCYRGGLDWRLPDKIAITVALAMDENFSETYDLSLKDYDNMAKRMDLDSIEGETSEEFKIRVEKMMFVRLAPPIIHPGRYVPRLNPFLPNETYSEYIRRMRTEESERFDRLRAKDNRVIELYRDFKERLEDPFNTVQKYYEKTCSNPSVL